MAQCQAVITRRGVESLPSVLPQRLADHLGDKREGVRKPGDKAQGLELHRIIFAVELAIGNEITRRRRLREGRQQSLGSVLENLAIGSITVPSFAHQRHASVLRHQQFQHGLLQVRTMVFRVAMGDCNGLLVTLGNVVASERETRRVEMGKTLINGFLPTHDKGKLAKEQVTAYSQNIRARLPTGDYASTIIRARACLLLPSHPYSAPRGTVKPEGEMMD